MKNAPAARWYMFGGILLAAAFAMPLTVSASAISFIGQASANAASVTLPAFSAGDVAVVFAYRDNNATAPLLPGGWTNILNGGANTNAARIGYRILQAGDTTTGTWTNATQIVVHVYRGVDSATSIGASAAAGASSITVSYPALTLQITDGTSWVAGFGGYRTNSSNIQNAPTGMTNRSDIVGASAGEAAGHDTNGGVSSWSAQNVTVSGSATGYRSFTVELRATPAAPTVSTDSATAFSTASADLFGTLVTGTQVTQHGFAYSTNSMLSSGVSTTTDGALASTGSFSRIISSLTNNTTYYYRAYATNSGGTSYGSIKSFTSTGSDAPARVMRLFEGYKIKLVSGTLKVLPQ